MKQNELTVFSLVWKNKTQRHFIEIEYRNWQTRLYIIKAKKNLGPLRCGYTGECLESSGLIMFPVIELYRNTPRSDRSNIHN